MITAPAPVANLSPAVRAFAERHDLGAEALRSDGSLTLTVDKRYRVRLRSAPHNRVALQSQLLSLPSPGDPKVGQMLDRLMKLSAGMLRSHASTLCLDARQQSLQLQQTLPAHADADAVEEALADFANALAFWTKLCRAESAIL